ncbi:MAG: ketopantoate reductase family protein [Actinomycetota bacterium]|nr:ketopantoate reductase family protein [Actinomycetota bacterium]
MGAGAVGGYFGSHLAMAGREVTFLVRPARDRLMKERGLVLHSADGETHRIEPQTVSAPAIGGAFDLVLLAVKAYALEGAMDDLGAAVGPATLILPALNGIRHIEALQARFGRGHVLGGVCVVMTQLEEDGAIRQLLPGASLAYGSLDGPANTRLDRVHATLSGAGFDTSLSQSIELEMWEKWMILAAGGALTTLLRGTAGEITRARGGLSTAREIIRECVDIATAAGFAPRRAALDFVEQLLLEPGSKFATSMYRDLMQGHDVEADQILGDLLDRAERLRVHAPLTTAAYAALSAYMNAKNPAAARHHDES